jgi:hypothetical protein
MTNKEIYKKTIGFTWRRILLDWLTFLVLLIFLGLGFFIATKINSEGGLIGLVIGGVIGLIIVIILMRYISYTYKAGQIAMMTKGVTEGELPEDVIGEGKKVVKERFLTIAAFFAITGVIKGIFNQIGNAITGVGKKVGGNTGEGIGNAISSFISVVVAYLCDCCLGWVFYRKDEKASKAACEGAVLFFKHGKTFFKNMGRIFGIGLLTLLLIGGVCGLILVLIFRQFPAFFENLSAGLVESLSEEGEPISVIISNPEYLMIACAVVIALIIWSTIHSTFIRPLVLVGVLRNYMESGMNEVITESDFDVLDTKSKKFKKLHEEFA